MPDQGSPEAQRSGDELRARVVPGSERVQLQAEGLVNPAGQFEIMAITAGKGNGWTFGADVLRASLALWEHVETFVDHGELTTEGHSLRDLGGVAHSPAWDDF